MDAAGNGRSTSDSASACLNETFRHGIASLFIFSMKLKRKRHEKPLLFSNLRALFWHCKKQHAAILPDTPGNIGQISLYVLPVRWRQSALNA